MSEINYTITSSDPNDYGIIRESLITPQTENTEFMITQLTTMCSFVILNKDDYIELVIYRGSNLHGEKVKIYWMLESTKLNYESFREYINLAMGSTTAVTLNDVGLPYFFMDCHFAFSDVSNRMKIVLGMLDVKFDKTEYYYIHNIMPSTNRIQLKRNEDYLIILFESDVCKFLDTEFIISEPMSKELFNQIMKTNYGERV